MSKEKLFELPEIGRITLPRLQITNESSPSKPVNYRISPIASQSTSITNVDTDISILGSRNEADKQATFEGPPTQTGLYSILRNWSGRGAHVDFLPDEQVPLKEGRFLGHGSMGSVFETSIQGHAFAWKRRFCRRRIGDAERKEIEILNKVYHLHIIQLVGSYTHRQFLGLLLYPVALCDLATLLEDWEAYFSARGPEASQRERLVALRLIPSNENTDHEDLESLLSKIGCIVRAVEYLHSRKIRHKDLKPSNILLSPNGLWLTDFGTATDFSSQTLSTTENLERGTPKYFAPEVAAFQPSGRAADIFSLGCVILEIQTIHQLGSLEALRNIRIAQDRSFQANLDDISKWIRESVKSDHVFYHHMKAIISEMLTRLPDSRPTITRVRWNLALLDTIQEQGRGKYLFGNCCRRPFIPQEEHEQKMEMLSDGYEGKLSLAKSSNVYLIQMLKERSDSLLQVKLEMENLVSTHAIAHEGLQNIVHTLSNLAQDAYPFCDSCEEIFSSHEELGEHERRCHNIYEVIPIHGGAMDTLNNDQPPH